MYRLLSVAFAISCYSMAAESAVYCVDTAAEIQSAFASANSDANGTVQDIRVRPGSYSFSASLSFNSGEDKEFSLTGGWNSGCTARTINSAATVLNAGGAQSNGTDFSFTGNQRSFRIEGIRFQNFRQFFLFESICPFGQSCPDTDFVRVRYNEFLTGLNVIIVANDAQIYNVSNNLMAGLLGNAGVDATVDLAYENADARPEVAFNTFSLACNGSIPALSLFSERNSPLFAQNIVATSGCATAITVPNLSNAKPWLFRENLYPALPQGLLPAGGSTGNIISPTPGFVGGGDFRLRETAPVSAAINAGLNSIEASQLNFSAPAQDLDGPVGSRLIGTRYDMGAYESSINDLPVLTVTNENDSGAGSLRAAITSANATPGPQKIVFDITGSCNVLANLPLVQLLTPLPDIVDTLEIDGYSQPGAAPNTQTLGSDAVICVAMSHAFGSTMSHYLQVPANAPAGASLTLRGIAFNAIAGSATSAVRLRGGSDHIVQGNAFGGAGPGVHANLGTFSFGLRIEDNAQDVTVGGPEPEHRNSFGGQSTTGLVLFDSTSSGHTIQNNYIGVAASGLAASPITGNGIFASASPDVRILDNVIAASQNSAGLSITGATATGYEIARNRFGTAASGVPTPAFRNASGIVITGGSGNHQIGGILNSAASNTITNSEGPGVHLTTSAGVGVAIRPNRIFANGLTNTLAQNIELGDLGPLDNDPGDADGGPNNGQNKPVINSSTINPDGTRQVSGSLATQNGQYIIDIYRSPDCPNGRANLLNLVGTQFVTNLVGVAGFNLSVPGSATGGVLSAVATRVSNGDTSEASLCFLEPSASTTTITADTPDPSVFGQPYQVTAQTTSPSGTPSGEITISDGSGVQCVITLSGSGSCQMLSNSLGNKTLTASYPGSLFHLPSSDTEPHQINPVTTLLSITSDQPDPSEVGQPYEVQVQVRTPSGNLAVPQGTVTVSDGTGQTCQIASLSGGNGSCALTSTTAGNKTLSATFSGGPNFLSSNDTESHVVVPASTTTTILSDAPDPSLVGQNYTVVVTVAANLGFAVPTGTVGVSDGSGASCNIVLSAGGGFCQMASSSPGQKTLTALYEPNSQAFATSQDTEAHTVNLPPTITTITSDQPDPSEVNQSYTVVVLVQPSGGGATPTGTVSIDDGSGASCNNLALTNGTASCQLTSTSAGQKTLTATYSGNASYAPSNDTEPHTVINPVAINTTTNITGNAPNPSRVGEPYTVSIAVTAANGGTPNGVIQVNTGAGGLSCNGVVTNGVGSCQLTGVVVGDALLTACFAAGNGFNGSCDNEVHSVIKADTELGALSVSPSPSNAGQAVTASMNLSVTAPGAGTPTGTVVVSASANESCSITLPAVSCQLTLTQSGMRNITFSYQGDASFNPSTRSVGHQVNDSLFANGFE